ncbi:MAG TPA: HlyD family secretion protein [Tepidisphaeraceae bacterium]|nr:HlyD family secretion protein [Tepidisphaeraceae bacterium]
MSNGGGSPESFGAELPPKRPIYKRPWIAIPLGIVALAAVVGGILYYVRSRQYESTDDAFVAGQVIQISPQVAGIVQGVSVTDNQAVQADEVLVQLDPRDYEAALSQARGALASAMERAQSAQAALEAIRVTSEADVQQAKAGVDQANSGLTTAQAGVEAAKSQVGEATARVAAGQAAVSQAQAELAAAEAEQTRAGTELQRQQEAAARGAVSQQTVTNALAAARSADAQVEAGRKKIAAAEASLEQARAARVFAEHSLTQAQARVGQAEGQVAEAKGKLQSVSVAPQRVAGAQADWRAATAEVERLKGAFRQAELNLSYTKITSPVAGHVTNKQVEPGDYVDKGRVLMAIVSQDLWVVANFKETQLDRIKRGDRVRIQIDAYPGKEYRGHVDSVQRGSGAAFSLLPPENATGNYVKVVQRVPVKIVFDEAIDPRYPLGPGMSVVPEVKVQ